MDCPIQPYLVFPFGFNNNNNNNLLPSHFTCIMIVLSLRDLFGHDIQPRYLSSCFLVVYKQFV